ncbi:methyltransferase [Streptomyces kanamyceticus]|uniref:SAM-dependent methyltransferase n=1 Tax=Streptomyces kanamyceticus TaxID=1967 RepID=A0A5J6GS55_STRKN|nr:methyltransferase [Streptomyces kanamyceticus]QEU96835.1 SAM-dependent methyltransferase [Streptomyces kanamyceticus]
MAGPDARALSVHPADLALIDETVERVATARTDDVVKRFMPRLAASERAALVRHCALAHAAVLVSAPSVETLRAALRARGLDAGKPVPSVIVRRRLADRYGRTPDSLRVDIVRVPVPVPVPVPAFPPSAVAPGERAVEIFVLEAPPGAGLDTVAVRERAARHESHLALEVTEPDDVIMAGLRTTLVERGAMVPDGGGYNAYEDATALYFRTEPGAGDPESGVAAVRGSERLELHARGEHRQALTAHRAAGAGQDPARRLLELCTGAWTTQALAAAVRLGLPDALPTGTESAADAAALAARTGTDPDGLGRLLRYLASIDVVAADGDRYRLGPLGSVLRSDAPHSMAPLAELYGGPFYASFGELDHAVRTGEEAFTHLYGEGHFAHFAERPELDVLFQRTMAASAARFGPVAAAVAASGARLVVDVGGCDGELLGRVLAAGPDLHGVLLEREHVLESARARLTEAGVADRCALVAGDFTESVPSGGDVYLLSRILHDWDDEACLRILRRCADAMPPGAELLVVERLLPQDGQPSLATAWDLHMLCNVGGRERTAEHYGRLLAGAGLDLGPVVPLALDGFLLRARKAAQATMPPSTGSTVPVT